MLGASRVMGVCHRPCIWGCACVFECRSASDLTHNSSDNSGSFLWFPSTPLLFPFRFLHGIKRNPTAAGRSTLSAQGETF